jgi:hypothetical protein
MGSKNQNALASLREYEEALGASPVQVQVMDGLTHMQEFTDLERVLPVMLAFMRA